jgi:spore germination protein KC
MNLRGIEMILKLCRILLFILLIICLSGCWDSAELQDLSIVSGIGIDKGEDNVENRYRATVQIIDPTQIAGGQQGGKVQSSPVTTMSATGSTLKEALRKISHKAPSELFFPHVQVMLIGEELAKEGILDLFDAFERDPHFRVLFPILIVRDHTAEDALKVTTSLKTIPSSKIVESLESSKEIWGEYPVSRADQVIAKLKEGNLGIAGIQINGDVEKGNKTTNMQQISQDTKIELKGLALMKDGKIKKWLENNRARGVMWITNELKRTVMSLDCPKKKDAIAIEIARANSDIKIEINNDKPVINLTINTEGSISETQCSLELNKNKTINELNKQLSIEIKEEVMSTLKSAQEEKSDIIGFGDYINIEDKQYWKKIEKKWEEEIFPETEINVHVHAAIRRTGMRVKSYIK